MLSPKIDLIIRGEYVISSASSKHWTYSEEQEDFNGVTESKTWNANWVENQGPIPEINYEGWIITLGIRKLSFSSFTFN